MCGNHERYEDYVRCYRCGKRLCLHCRFLHETGMQYWYDQGDQTAEDMIRPSRNKWTTPGLVPFEPFEWRRYVCKQCPFVPEKQTVEVIQKLKNDKPKKPRPVSALERIRKKFIKKAKQTTIIIENPDQWNPDEIEKESDYSNDLQNDDDTYVDAIHDTNWDPNKWYQ